MSNRATELRVAISDFGREIDSQKTKRAAAMGIGVFLGLLAAIGAYDLRNGNAGLWLAIGITDGQLTALAAGFGVAALLLILYGIRLHQRRDYRRERELEMLMQELEELEARETATKS